MKKGVFISFEGIEGSGKTTHCQKVIPYLEKKGFQVVHIHEPGGTEIGEQLRSMLLSGDNEKMCDRTELLLVLASRSQVVAEVIAPALKAGKAVVCDRYIDSTVAYQAYGRGIDEKTVRNLNQFVTRGLYPDLTIILDIEAPTGLRRTKDRQDRNTLDRIERAPLGFHQRIREGYLALARNESNRVRLIECDKDIKKTERAVKRQIGIFLNKRKASEEK